MHFQIMMARTTLKKTFPEKPNDKNFPKIQKCLSAVSSAIWDHLSQVFKFYKT